MDIKTGLSILNKPWLIEPQAGLMLLDYWVANKSMSNNWKHAVGYSDDEDEVPVMSTYEITTKFFAKDGVLISPTNRWGMRDFKGFDGASVAIIPIAGPLMKADYCGDFGTASLSQMTQLASRTNSVHTILFVVDSPGGTVDGTQSFSHVIGSSNKRTITATDGYMCSAAYWIGSSSKEIIATSPTDTIGSIGTMCQWYDNTEAARQMGYVLREYYATKSVDKNKDFRNANTGDGRLLIEEHLDPLNDIFLNSVRENRSGKIKGDEVLTGKTFISDKAISTGLIDGIRPMEQVIEQALSQGGKNKPTPKTHFMSKNNIRFTRTLEVAKATELQVVEGGFLMTEEHLQAIDDHINNQDTIMGAAGNDLKRLQGMEASFNENADAVQKLAEAQTKITSLETKITGLENQQKDLADAGKDFFSKTTKPDSDKGAAHETEEVDLSQLSHNRKADAMWS